MKNPRINVTFTPQELDVISQTAKHKGKSIASLVKDLTIESLEILEDKALCKFAEESDKQTTNKTYSHEEAWEK